MVSVILPNYNHAAYLKQRIDSILNQTFQDFELIILDDHSTDNSRAVIERYKGNVRISHIVFNDANSGSTFKQWTKGIALAKGELIWIAESDDFSDHRFLEMLISRFVNRPDIGLVYSQSWVADKYGKKMYMVSNWLNLIDNSRWARDYENSGNLECADYLITQNIIFNASAVIFRKGLFLEAYEETSLKLMGDWLLWFNLLMKSDLAYISEPLNFFRTHKKNVRNKFADQVSELKETIFVVEKMRKSVDNINPDGAIAAYKIAVNRVLTKLVNNRTFNNKDELNKYIFQQFQGTGLPPELVFELNNWIDNADLSKSKLTLISLWLKSIGK